MSVDDDITQLQGIIKWLNLVGERYKGNEKIKHCLTCGVGQLKSIVFELITKEAKNGEKNTKK